MKWGIKLTIDRGASSLPNCQAFLTAGFSVAINHLLKHTVDAIKTALSGARVIEAGESVAVVEAASCTVPATLIVWGMVKNVIYLNHR
jgi:hypothetical protein